MGGYCDHIVTLSDTRITIRNNDLVISDNTSNQTIHLGEYNIIIKDEEGILITEIKLNLDYDLKAGEEFYTTNSINEDLSNAYEMELNIKE